MQPDSSKYSAVPAWRGPLARNAARAALAAALTVGTTGALVQVPLASAQEAPAPAPAAAPDDLSGLIRAVADASARLDVAQQDIRVKREDVNKTLVDLQVARVELDDAIEDHDTAVRDRERADGDLGAALGKAQDYSRMLYRQGTAPGAASQLVDPSGPADAGRRQELLERVSADQRGVVDRLERARTEAGDRERASDEALGVAQRRHDDAVVRRDDAQRQITEVSDQVLGLEQEVRDLTGRLDEARRALAAQGGPVAPEPAQQYAGEVPGENRDVADVRKADAIRRLAANPQAADLAKLVAGALPSHLDLGEIRDLAAGSSDTAREYAGGTIDAGSVGEAVDAGAAGDTDALVQQVVDAVRKADTGSAGDGVPEPAGPPSTPSSSPKPSTSTTRTTEPGAGKTTGAESGKDSTPSAPVTGDASKKVEIVVDRAMSQLGLPYAWGGGDAKGPTKGIRDGGVADSYGDYNKVGFDCSGLMIYAFAGIGKALPHYTGYQYESGRKVPVSERKRGDMLFWPGHVALYLGDGTMIEAPQSGDVVKISPVRMGGIMPYAVRMVD